MWQQLPHPKSPSLRLSILTQFYPPDYAATGQLIQELATHLGEQGVEVDVFTGQPGYAFHNANAPATERSGNVVVRRSHSSRLWSERIRGKAINGILFCVRSLFYLFRSIRRSDVFLFTTAPPYLPILGYLFHRISGKSYVCLIYDLYPDIAIHLNVISLDHWLGKLWESLNRKVWRNAEQVIVLSSNMRDLIIQKCPDIEAQVVVIHNWANPDWIVPLEKQENWFAHQHGLAEKFTILYSGNMGRCHDLDTVLNAAVHLSQEPVQFTFIGGGAQRPFFMEKVRQLGLQNCFFLPYQQPQFLPYSLTACDLALVTIRQGMEGLVAPSKFYSSLAAGRPVAAICEPHSYLRQILTEAGCGRAFSHGDGEGLANFIRWLLCHPQAIAQMGMAGRRYLQDHFTLDIIARQYAEVLHQSVQFQGRRSRRRRYAVRPSEQANNPTARL
jgi:glycosyltransferase involved in cell wall biosynthesis